MRLGARLVRSVRTRLALWHTAVLALVLVAFTLATWGFLERLTQQQVDRSLAEAVSAFQQALLSELRAHRTPDQAAQDAAQEFRFSGRRVLVYGSHHSLIAVSDSARDRLTQAISAIDDADDSPIHPIFASLTPGASAYATVGEGSQLVRAFATSVTLAGEAYTIVALQIGLSEQSILATFLHATAIAIPLALVLAGMGGYLLARRSFDPVVDMGRRAASIDSQSLDARLAIRHTGDEMDELATVFNAMLARLQRSFFQQRQFMADASHELRTPLASLRAEASIALSQARTNREYEASLEQVRDETRRLSAIVDDLFTLARLDAEESTLRPVEFYLEELIHRCVSRMRPLAADRGLSLTFVPAVEARCLADPELVDRVLTNLLDNATKYTPPGGSVCVELETDGARHRVRVRDDGTGIPVEAQPFVFDRFFRADQSRTRATPMPSGAGLGLSIAWTIARAHGGALELTSSDARGTVFTLTLPAQPSLDPGRR
jgi:two-component system, OmpR family, sensor kinase